MRASVLLLLLYGCSVRSFSFGSIRARPAQDLTISDVSAMFQEVRAHYRSSGEVDEAQACRNLMSTRVKDLRTACCAVRPSPLHGDGLFATREVAEGELLSFFPADALLVWEGGDRERNDCLIFFGAHVPKEERDAARILDERARDYELYVSPVFSAVGDPERRADPAYLGHLANDGATCASPERVEEYRSEAAAAANAVPVWVEGCHLALQASRPISTGEEVLYAYGEGWWLSRGGNEGAHEGQHEGAGRSSIRTVGAAMPPRAEGDRLRRALKPRPAKGASKAGAKAKPRKKGAPRAQPKKGAAKPKGFGAPAC